jgi:hypothetical protein
MATERPLWGYGRIGNRIQCNLRRFQTLAGLDAYGVWLADQGHTWSPNERKYYEQRVRELTRKDDS